MLLMSAKLMLLVLFVITTITVGCKSGYKNFFDRPNSDETQEQAAERNIIIKYEDVLAGKYVITVRNKIDLLKSNYDGLIAIDTETKEQISMKATIDDLLPDIDVYSLILFSQLPSLNQYILIPRESGFGDWIRPIYYKFDARNFSINYMNINKMFDATASGQKEENTKFGKFLLSPSGTKFIFVYDRMRSIPYEATAFSIADLVTDRFVTAVELDSNKETLDSTGNCNYDPIVDIAWESENSVRYAVYDIQKKYKLFGDICAPVEDSGNPEYVKQFFVEYRTYSLE